MPRPAPVGDQNSFPSKLRHVFSPPFLSFVSKMSRKMRYFRRNLNLYQELAREHVAHCERLKMAYSVASGRATGELVG
jgi:hypothetical protein